MSRLSHWNCSCARPQRLTSPNFKKIPSAAVTGGFLLQHESGRCIHPFEGAEDPRPNTDVILHSDCNRDRKALTWIQDPQLLMKRNSPWCYCNSLDRGPELLSILESFSLIQIRQLHRYFVLEVSSFVAGRLASCFAATSVLNWGRFCTSTLGDWELREVMKADSLGQETRRMPVDAMVLSECLFTDSDPKHGELCPLELIQSTMSDACSCSEKVEL